MVELPFGAIDESEKAREVKKACAVEILSRAGIERTGGAIDGILGQIEAKVS